MSRYQDDQAKLDALTREKVLMWNRYQTLLSHPNPRLAQDAWETCVAVDHRILAVKERMRETA